MVERGFCKIFTSLLLLIPIKINCQILIPDACNVVGSLSGVICVTEVAFKLPDDTSLYYCPSGKVCANDPYICVTNTEPACKTNRQEGTGVDCNILGDLSGVICVTETSYKLTAGGAELFCPTGTVCANVASVCDSNSQPACKTNRCQTCFEGATSTCVGLKTYAACNNSVLDTAIRNCQASKPYCSVVFNNGYAGHSCTSIVGDVACDGTTLPNTTTTTTTLTPTDPEPPTPCPPAPDKCITYGKFKVTTDSTCRRYFYCYYSEGELIKAEYVCPVDTVFHPNMGKCVSPQLYKCV